MTTLVTGGAGFIGSHVVRQLLDRGDTVRVFHLPNEPLDNLDGLAVERFPGDIRDADAVRQAMDGCDRVFHLAAVYALWLPDPNVMFQVNIGGTRNIMEAAADQGVQRVVYTSSIARFGGHGAGTDATEDSPFALGPTGEDYARSKAESHELVMDYVRGGLDVVTVAPCGPVGPGDIGPTPTGKLLLMAANWPVVVSADTWANMIDVRDVAAGHLLADEKGQTGESYLLGNENVSMIQLVRRTLKMLEINKPVIQMPMDALEVAAHGLLWLTEHVTRKPPLVTPAGVRISRLGLRADCRKSREQLGLPQHSVDDAIRDAMIWWAARGYVTDRKARRRIRALRASAHPLS